MKEVAVFQRFVFLRLFRIVDANARKPDGEDI
jgi:hypothetical protein